MKNNIKVLFIGLGGIGQRHLRNIHSNLGDSANLIAYRERGLTQTVTPQLTIDKDVDFTKKFFVDVFTDLDKALAQSPDVAFICNPSGFHVPTCLAVAKAGCDFFVEKPLSNSMDKIDELVYQCGIKNLITLVGFQLRFHPCYILLKKFIEMGEVGDLLSVHVEVGEYLPEWHKYEDYRQMYASRRNLGGGVVLSQIHEIDYLYDLFGMPSKVYTIGGHLSSLEIDVEDVADILMEMIFKGRSLPVLLHMDYIQRPPSRGCKIIGELGKITMDLTASKVTVEKPNENKEIYDFSGFDRNELFVDEINHFFNCVNTRERPIVTVEDGVYSLKIALSIKESMETGQIIALQ